MSKFTAFCNKSINFIFGIIVGWLFVLSLFMTSYMNSEEHSYVTIHSPLMYILVVGFVVVCMCFLSKMTGSNKANVIAGGKLGRSYKFEVHEKPFKLVKNEKIIKWALLSIIFIECLFFVLGGKATPVSDQFEVLSAAVKLNAGDYSPFAKGGYIYMYSIQSGLVIVYSLLLRLFDYDSVVVLFQILSAIGITFTYKLLYDISSKLGLPVLDRLFILVLGVIFIPYNIYSMFVYGTVIGFVCALAAIKWEIEFIESNRIWNAFLSALFLLMSLVFKPNYLIFFVGIVIALFLSILKDVNGIVGDKSENGSNKKNIIHSASGLKIIKRVSYLLVIILCYFLATSGPKKIIANISGCALDNPMASVAWLEMGLQNGPRAEGWYNAYNADTYNASDCDGIIQSIVVKEDLKLSIQEMTSHKKDTIRFFTKKTASQWLNPTFESFWSIQQMGNADRRMSVISRMLHAANINKMTTLFSFFEVIVLFGAVLFVFMNCFSVRSVDGGNATGIEDGYAADNGNTYTRALSTFIYEIIFIGGFVFYMFWEAKGQYTIVYFMMLLPMAMAGYEALWSKAKNIEEAHGEDKKAKRLAYVICGLAILISVVSLICMRTVDENGIKYWDVANEKYSSYKTFFSERCDGDYSGEFILSPATASHLSIGNEGEDIQFTENSISTITVKPVGSVYRIGLNSDSSESRYLSIYRNADGGYNTEAAVLNDLDGEFWKFENTGDGQSVYIYNSTGYGLAYNAEGNYAYMSDRSDSDSQKWILK